MELILVEGWPAFRLPSGRIAPVLAGGEGDFFGDDASAPALREGADGNTYTFDPESGRWVLAPGMPVNYGAGQQARSAAAIEYGTKGEAYVWDGTDYVRDPRFDDPTKAAGYQAPPRTSYSVSQSYRDPADVQLDRDTLNERIRAAQVQEARDGESLSLARDKARVEEEQGNTKLALEQQSLAESIAARIERTQLERQQMQQQALQFDRELAESQRRQMADQQFEATQSAADRAFRGSESEKDRGLTREGMNQRAQEAAMADQRQRATAAAEFAAGGATDFGKLASFLGNGGMSPLSTAIGQGQSAITDTSLEPLAGLMQPTQQPQGMLTRAINGPVSFGEGGYTPEQAAQIQQRINETFAGQVGAAAQGFQNTNAINTADDEALRAAGITTFTDLAAQFGAGGNAVKGSTEGNTFKLEKAQDGAAVVDGKTLTQLMSLVHALGMQPKAVAGERGKANGETVYSNGDVVIMPDKGAGLPQMQYGGGILSQAFRAVDPQALELARQYQSRAGQEALRRSGLTDTPAPVMFSDPGTDPALQELGASVAAVTRGIPRSSYLNELMKVTPVGMSRGLNRRSY